jgi:hypothetical protein
VFEVEEKRMRNVFLSFLFPLPASWHPSSRYTHTTRVHTYHIHSSANAGQIQRPNSSLSFISYWAPSQTQLFSAWGPEDQDFSDTYLDQRIVTWRPTTEGISLTPFPPTILQLGPSFFFLNARHRLDSDSMRYFQCISIFTFGY